ncbi:MAG: hypothetical protein ABIL58_00965 [Pseudomonadota bacterium]
MALSPSLQFISDVFGDKPDELFIQLWRKNLKGKGGLTFCTQSVREAAEHAEKIGKDVYMGVGLAEAPVAATARCAQENIAGIGGLWLDVDIMADAHKSKKLPATLDEALSIVKGNGFDPTMIVHSGNGIHCWWLFKESWAFADAAERNKARFLSQQLVEYMRRKGKVNGWGIDGTQDLSRVLRIPGTKNVKDPDNHKIVRILERGGTRYNPEDFSEYFDGIELIVEEPVPEAGAPAVEFAVNATAEPPHEKLDMLMEIDEKFKATVQRKRTFPSGDSSTSSYHFALTFFALRAGWSDQEVANLLVYWNRRHAANIPADKLDKVHRPDYINRTLLSVKKKLKDDFSAQILDEHDAVCGTAAYTPEDKARAKSAISQKLGINIIRIVQYMQDDPTYLIETDKGNIHLPTVTDLLTQSRLRAHIANLSLQYMPHIKREDWPKYGRALLLLAEREMVSDESTAAGQVRSWLTAYIEQKPALPREDAAPNLEPYLHIDGCWHIFADKFQSWCVDIKYSNFTIVKLRRVLHEIGVREAKRFNIRIDGRYHTRRPLKVPASMFVGPRYSGFDNEVEDDTAAPECSAA